MSDSCNCGECRQCDPYFEDRLIEWEKSVDPSDVDRPYDWEAENDFEEDMENPEWPEDGIENPEWPEPGFECPNRDAAEYYEVAWQNGAVGDIGLKDPCVECVWNPDHCPGIRAILESSSNDDLNRRNSRPSQEEVNPQPPEDYDVTF